MRSPKLSKSYPFFKVLLATIKHDSLHLLLYYIILYQYDHITPVLESLHWLPVKFRIVFKVLLLVYKALNGMAPPYLSDMLCYRSYSRSLRSASQKLLVVHRTNMKTYGDRAFSIAGPKLWNQLPLSIRELSSVDSFKKSLRPIYFVWLILRFRVIFFLLFFFFYIV